MSEGEARAALRPEGKRATNQPLLPLRREPRATGVYDVYPAFDIGPGKIGIGFEHLAKQVKDSTVVTIDGYGGVLWEDFVRKLRSSLAELGVSAKFIPISLAYRSRSELERLARQVLEVGDDVFGTRYTGGLQDFIDSDELREIRPDSGYALNIVYGCGAALAGWGGLVVYVDVAKNEVQYRARAGSIANLGATASSDPGLMYRRFYFLDWPVLNLMKAELLPTIDIFVDGQDPDQPRAISGGDIRAALTELSHSSFRARPWFEPGAWGGQWMKHHIQGLDDSVPNYAWSFELITPENGVLLESDGYLLEFSFDLLMYHDKRAILGDAADRFGVEFPIRFDFLDTVDGGNLSIQCHPGPAYIRERFGENFTQDETYYILDCVPGARVFLGLTASADVDAFESELRTSEVDGRSVDVDRYVNSFPAHRHDLFLIPHGTIHSAGAGNLVLEISATPYIFTFKMYDWLRPDLDGRPRKLSVDHAMANLNRERRGKLVGEELVSRPTVLGAGQGWRKIRLPTHPDHFYDVHRIEFNVPVELETGNSVHVMNLVEGDAVRCETANGRSLAVNYAETFVVPAAAGSFRLVPVGDNAAKVVDAAVKQTPPSGDAR